MVEARLKLEPEVIKIFDCIDKGEHFLLSGGAGSGKTYSLVQVIRQVIAENPTTKVACMTYTNAAVKEIEDRVNHKNLNVTTIHDFLWDNIKHFQKELRSVLVKLLNNDEVPKISFEGNAPIPTDYFDALEKGIQYREYLRIKDGIISHDELLVIANKLFEEYPRLCDIVKDRYKFIFIDEYQDTSKLVIDIFLIHFNKTIKNNIIGFFGDAMQSIYDDSVGNLDAFKGIEPGKVKEIKKEQNRRNPQKVIALANKLRTDGIEQKPSLDMNAPNMAAGSIKEGTALFIYSADSNIDRVRRLLADDYNWRFELSAETKELNLTHNLIADKAGFRNLMDIYDKDQILNYRDRVKNYIKDNAIATDFSLNTFGEVVEILKNGKTEAEMKPILPTPAMSTFITANPILYKNALEYNYAAFSKIYVSKDQLLDDKKQEEDDENKKGSKRDNLINHLYKIQTIISLYNAKKYNEFLRVTDYIDKIKSISNKIILKYSIELLTKVGDKTIEEIINLADENEICLKDDRLGDFIKNKEYLYNRVKDVKFSEFQKLFRYLEGSTPFSTKHKTKGAEFNNVLVILDNGNWFDYNFNYLFDKDYIFQMLVDGKSKTKSKLESFPTILARTQKIFYVSCTRAKENLAVFFYNPSDGTVNSAKEWFGETNVINLD